MRKELCVYIKTADDDELSLNSTKSGVVVLSLPNGIKVGLNPKELKDALFEIEFFKNFQNPNEPLTVVTNQKNIIDIGEI